MPVAAELSLRAMARRPRRPMRLLSAPAQRPRRLMRLLSAPVRPPVAPVVRPLVKGPLLPVPTPRHSVWERKASTRTILLSGTRLKQAPVPPLQKPVILPLAPVPPRLVATPWRWDDWQMPVVLVRWPWVVMPPRGPQPRRWTPLRSAVSPVSRLRPLPVSRWGVELRSVAVKVSLRAMVRRPRRPMRLLSAPAQRRPVGVVLHWGAMQRRIVIMISRLALSPRRLALAQ
ncbi:hypothetical protein C4K37_5703 [Pseudomonas chlororaphis subsp. piscium]|uniref:Uncharacterized protein n=1 Tax=Pseudomonas chlororaphis TaxID=587753 RepID=A0AAX3FYI3_9PSED|nr:hypothetical protein C4K37_5703 [Pseudomonas chlororaphis subsp. piscium]AZC46616.1 hypothetical protein C4K36_5722 [Pseudomonas chlororaphis subsp. piscium]VEF74505.1 Uncharacterised protein [Pseudomonas chlororaphis]